MPNDKDRQESASERVRVIAKIYNFENYTASIPLLDDVMGYERRVVGKILVPNECNDHLGELEQILEEVRSAKDPRYLLVQRMEKKDIPQTLYVLDDEDGLQNAILETDKNVDEPFTLFLYTSKGGQLKRNSGAHVEEEFEELVERASESSFFVQDEIELLRYGFVRKGTDSQELAQYFQTQETAWKGTGLTRLLSIASVRGTQGNMYRTLLRAVNDYGGKGYTLLKKGSGGVDVRLMEDADELFDKIMFNAIDTNSEDYFWVLSPIGWFEKEPKSIDDRLTLENWDETSQYS